MGQTGALSAELRAQFMSLEEARPVLAATPGSVPAELQSGSLNEARWANWLRSADANVRRRLEAGEEDTLSNLLRFGVTFTTEYRIDDEYFARYGESSLVDSFARRRADDLLRALARPAANQGFCEMRALLERKGFAIATPAGRAAARRFLLQNLARMHGEFMEAKRRAKSERYQMFQDRGISLDSNLWPDYDLDLQFRRMAEKGMLQPRGVRRIAIVGPGLDFVNKQEGVDYYPPQTVQPFAVLDSLLRLGLADAATIEVDTLDISARVNNHLAASRRRAASGQSYLLQLPWFAAGRWSDPFRAAFGDYWKVLGSAIGEPVAPIPVPNGTQGIETRAVRVRPAMVERVKPVDMNIVYQMAPLPAEQRFDLIIGTNIFLYYGPFEQGLAKANVAGMLSPGGYLLSTERLAESAPSPLALAMTTEVAMTGPPVITDYIFCYRRAN